MKAPGEKFQKMYSFGSEITVNGKTFNKYYVDWDGVYQNKITIVRDKETGEKIPELQSTKLANFDAKIIEEVRRDNGLDIEREYLINCELLPGGVQLPPLHVSADEFASMRWAYSYDVRAVVEPYVALRDILRAAIQERSKGDFAVRTVYTHTGWTKIGGEWAYLHSGGAITAKGPDPSVAVELNTKLQSYCLPEPHAIDDDFKRLLENLDGIADVIGLVSLGYTLRPILNEMKHAELYALLPGSTRDIQERLECCFPGVLWC